MQLHHEALIAGASKPLEFNLKVRGLLSWLNSQVFTVIVSPTTSSSKDNGVDILESPMQSAIPDSPGFGDLLSPIAKEPSRRKSKSSTNEIQLYAKHWPWR